jgi:flagellar biosynthesis/type III secretory pathway protein FliH
MAPRLIDMPDRPPEDARLIGRQRPPASRTHAVSDTAGRGAIPKKPAAATEPTPVAEQRLTLAEVEKLVAERVAQSSAKAAAKAHQEGFSAGVKSVESAQHQWLEKLQTGIDESVNKMDKKLVEVEQLAVELARLTLERVLGCDEARAQLLQEIVRHQMSTLSNATVLRVRLSEREMSRFPDLMIALEASYGGGRIQIIQDAQLAAGDCVFELKLGQVDAGIDTQMELIRAHFARSMEKNGSA